MNILSSSWEGLSSSVQSSLLWLGEKLHLTPTELSSVQEKLGEVVRTSREEREGIGGSLLSRSWTLMGDGLKFLAQGSETFGDIAILTERIFESPQHKSVIDNFKMGYMILEKIPFLGSYVESLIAKMPYFIEIAEKIDTSLAERIKAGDGEATSQMVQKILALFEAVNNQLQHTTAPEETKEKSTPASENSGAREGLFSQIIGRAWRGAVDYLKIMAQGNETLGDVVVLAEQLTEGHDTKNVADSFKVLYMVLEKIPLLGSGVESILPSLPYFMEIAKKLDPALAEKITQGDGEATSQMVQKMLASFELLQNQLSYHS